MLKIGGAKKRKLGKTCELNNKYGGNLKCMHFAEIGGFINFVKIGGIQYASLA